jgi:hypothetical protein
MRQHAVLMVCRFPFYYQIKLLVVLWLIAPQTQVSSSRAGQRLTNSSAASAAMLAMHLL